MAKTYTIDELIAMPDDELNALAGTVMGWSCPSSKELKKGAWPGYDKGNGEYLHMSNWRPAANRSQSCELLEWFTSRRFTVSIGRDQRGITDVGISHSDHKTVGAHHEDWARAETVAAVAMWLEMKKELS